MSDILDKETRRKLMSSVRSKNTSHELRVRKALFSKKLRYRIHKKNLPGSPDLVFPKYKAVVFIHGCFWHYHNCKKGKLPKTNQSFWKEKLEKNRDRDQRNIHNLESLGWRVAVIWGCDLFGEKRFLLEISRIYEWIINYPPSF